MKQQKAFTFKCPETHIEEQLNNFINDGWNILSISMYPTKKLAGKDYTFVSIICEKNI